VIDPIDVGITDLPQSVVNLVGMLEVVIREEVELVEKVPDVNTTQGVHLRERKHAWKPANISQQPGRIQRTTYVRSSTA
jgi:hypothetical protein